MTCYAHSTPNDRSTWQTVKAHLLDTAQLAKQLGRDAGVAEYARLAALLHDLGKYSPAFQRRLAGDPQKVDHSTAGAQAVVQRFQGSPNQRAIATLLAYCIAGHHGGLPDYGSVIDCAGENTLQGRLKKAPTDLPDYTFELDPALLSLPARLSIRPLAHYPGFSVSFFTRMIYSALVDADFLDTETFMNGGAKPRGGYTAIPELYDQFSHFLTKYANPQTRINRQRTETLNTCIARAEDEPGFFSLTVPTGGGKTDASMAFALRHAKIHGLQRVIYVIPYTSIIEQNAAKFKDCFGEHTVLEHHANFEFTAREDDPDGDVRLKLKLAAENWDIPIVVTTNVQFFESLFANRSSRCRKLHNIAKSAIIFDEAQMLPREYLQPCLYAVNELVKNYGATAVFCTATQPSIERFLPAGALVKEITPDPPALYEFYKRVRVQRVGRLSDDELTHRLNEHPQALCIVNTRKHARGLFKNVVDEGRFHLSTLMCPLHRRETIARIRQNLTDGLPCRVVSTQIMEAGIDVDFPVGYRALSGLDSIVQAAGRVNREGKHAQGGDLFVFEPDSPFVQHTPAYIRQGAALAEKILREYPDPVSLEAVRAYFTELYDLHGERAFDIRGILDCFDKRTADMNFDFRTAAEKFKLIENNTRPVVIPYNDSVLDLLEQTRTSPFPKSFARKLQSYTVNIYENEFRALEDRGLIELVADVYPLLKNKEAYYNDQTGLNIPASASGEGIYYDG